MNGYTVVTSQTNFQREETTLAISIGLENRAKGNILPYGRVINE